MMRSLTDLSTISQGSHHICLESSVEYVARHLFRALREFDALDVDVILIESVPLVGLGAAIMDRLQKAVLK
jgi:L-threonylcarbamoyladenylate synthase